MEWQGEWMKQGDGRRSGRKKEMTGGVDERKKWQGDWKKKGNCRGVEERRKWQGDWMKEENDRESG